MMRIAVIFLNLLPLPLLASWSLSGEALLLRPSVARSYAAIKAPANASTEVPLSGRWEGNTKPSYNWGYQVRLGYQRCSYDAQVSWNSWIHTDPFSLSANANQRIWLTFVHPNGNDAFVSPGELRRRDQYRVQAIDGEAGYTTCVSCLPITMRYHAGVRYTRIRYNVNIDASGTDSGGGPLSITDRWESDIQGTGPRGGVGVHYGLPCNLRLFGGLSASLLLGTAKGRYLDFLNDNGALSLTADRMSPANLMIGNFEGRFGLGWRCILWCFAIDAEVDYLLNYFSEGTLRAQFFDSAAEGVSAVTRDPFALDGWSFRLGVSY